MQPGNPYQGYYGPPQFSGQAPPRPVPPRPPYGFPPRGPPPPGVQYSAPPAPYSAYGPPPAQSTITMGYAPPPNVAVATPATLPLTIYVGKIPDSLDDAFFQRILAIFGTVTKWNRAPEKNFGFATFQAGLSALKCFTVLNGFEVDGQAILVKAGSKEQAIIDELREEQKSTNEQGFADELKELRSKLQTMLMQRDMMGDVAATAADIGEAPMAVVAPVPAPAPLIPEEEDPHEKFLREELEKFRTKQAIRDKDVEANRQARLEAKMKEIMEKANAAKNQPQGKQNENGRGSEHSESRGRSHGSGQGSERDRSRSRDHARRRNDTSDADRKRRLEVLAKMASEDIAELALEDGRGNGSEAMQPLRVGLKLQSKHSKAHAKGYQAREFAEEDEHGAKRERAIIPIDYTEEEKMAALSVQDQLAVAAARINASLAESSTDRNKEIVARIPKSTPELYQFPVDWTLINQHQVVETRIRPWVAKKVAQFLGEEVPTFTEFVCNMVKNTTTPKELTDEVQVVLDAETEPFVSNLWRMLAFYQLKLQDDGRA